MRLGKIVFFMLALALLTASCNEDSSKDEPAPEELLPGAAFVPQDVVPNSIFFANHERIVGYVLWPEVTVDDTDLQGEGYFSYDYWWAHRSEAQSLEDYMALCQVPQSVLEAMSTRNLVLTCFKHPYSLIYSAYNDQYYGVMVAMEANCFQELMRRKTGRAELLDVFSDLQYGDTILTRGDVSLNKWDYAPVLICLMTAVDCGVYDQAQVKRIASEVFNQIDDIVEFYSAADYVDWDFLRYPYLVGAILAHHNDEQLQDSEKELLYRFLGWQGWTGDTFSAEDVSNSTRIISESLERLVQ